jgi:hypothetical protein
MKNSTALTALGIPDRTALIVTSPTTRESGPGSMIRTLESEFYCATVCTVHIEAASAHDTIVEQPLVMIVRS